MSNVTVIIGPSGNGKSTLADAFGFLADCLEVGVEAASRKTWMAAIFPVPSKWQRICI